MHLPTQIAAHLRGIYFGGNWTEVNLRDVLADVTWQQATAQVNSLNTIAALVYHIGYYTTAQLAVLQNQPLTSRDQDSFAHPPIQSPADWAALLSQTWADAEQLATLIEQLPETQLWETFISEQYGSYYRNLQGAIEHAHYHLGQIVVVKKMLRANSR